MTPRISWLLCLSLLLSVSVHAGSKNVTRDAAAVYQAERLLDESTWSETILIHNNKPNRLYGAKVWALAFEFGGRVWIYLPQVGTQSPAVKASQLESDKANLSSLLKLVNRGFVSYERRDADAKIVAAIARQDEVPNGCLMESLATLRKMVRSGVEVDQAELLMYYANVGSSVLGHTVLLCETEGRRFVWDPEQPDRTQRIEKGYRSNALAIARVVAETGVRAKVAKAHLLPIAESDRGASYAADLGPRHFANVAN